METGRNLRGGPTRPGVPEAATQSWERGTDSPSGLQKDQPHDTLTVGPTAEPGEELLCVNPLGCGPALWPLSETDPPGQSL